jgi:splicing factor 3A subunit 3
MISVFYEQLKNVREYFRRFPAASHITPAASAESLENEPTVYEPVQFTGEESFGKFVDMIALHERYVNMPQFKKVDYRTFLRVFSQFRVVPGQQKNDVYVA